jgi:hypothetical protein
MLKEIKLNLGYIWTIVETSVYITVDNNLKNPNLTSMYYLNVCYFTIINKEMVVTPA